MNGAVNLFSYGERTLLSLTLNMRVWQKELWIRKQYRSTGFIV